MIAMIALLKVSDLSAIYLNRLYCNVYMTRCCQILYGKIKTKENYIMKKFLVLLQDINYDAPFTDEQIKQYTIAHIEHLRDLDAKGILYLCGPLKGADEGMIILNAESLEEAERYAFMDPFVVNNGYRTCKVYEIVEANTANNFLLED
jgi:uncharacterized protein YciI